MRLAGRPLALVAVTVLAACGSTTNVRSTRADPIGASVPSSGPGDTTAPGDTSGTTQPNTDSLDWGACDDPNAQDPALQCATLKVPLDYDKPDGDTIDLALIRQPASGNREGAVLFNPGGPGGSGFDPIAFSGSAFASVLGIDSLDLIGFDPRGVDRSGGIHCVSDEFRDKHLYVDDTPDTPEEQTLKDEAYNGFIEGCKQKYDDTLRLYSTENTARDMDTIREALGDDQISYLGISYGTYLGATYATMFPDRVRAMVLDSAYEPNGDTVQQQFETQLVGFEGAFDNWVKWCEGETTCEFKSTDVGARWDALKKKLDDTPITGTDGRVANNATMETATSAALYSESDWPVLAQALAKAENGDPAGIFAIADAYEGRNSDGTFNTLFQSFPVIQCASGTEAPPPADPEALATTLRAAAPRFGEDITAEDLTQESDECKSLVGNPKPVQLSYSGDGPVVVVGGTNDPATPIRWAQKMVAELGPSASLVTYTGEGHGAFLVSNCVTAIEGALLATLKKPAPDTTCNPDPPIEKPEWWDALPVPDGVSAPTSLPTLSAAVAGTSSSQIFSEMRTTTLSPQDAISAYTSALGDKGFQQFDAPSILPIDGVEQGAYSDFGTRTMVVLAIGPKAFDDKGLESAKAGIPANTTVLWLFAAPT
jgi:pimeloyl-ACP methyl ester carboxylesterase